MKPNKILNKIYVKLAEIKNRDKNLIIKKRSLTARQLIGEIKEEKKKRQSGDFSFIIDVDDACCLDGLNGSFDYGGKESGILDSFESFDRLHPYLKYTFFLIANPTFLQNGEIAGEIRDPDIYDIQNNIGSRFVEYLRKKQEEKKIEIAAHGLNHHQKEIPYFHMYAEFEFCNMTTACKKIIDTKNKITNSGFKVSGWKPPGWAFGSLLEQEPNLIDRVLKKNFSYIKISSPQNGLNRKNKKISHIYVTDIFGMPNVPQNINLTWSKREIAEVALAIADKGGVICPQFHFTPRTTVIADGVCDEMFEKLDFIIEKLGINKNNLEKVKTNQDLIN